MSIIAAISENSALGRNNRLLWHIPEDMKRFKELTLGHPVIMGRTTFESLGRPLPKRTNIIVTRNKNYQKAGCIIVHSLNEAVEKAESFDQKEIFIIGGGKIYEQVIAIADKLYLTLVKGIFAADTFFPDYSRFKRELFRRESHDQNYSYTFLELFPG
ncbi:dihydrofolate reductase [Candidatus Woesebacteria bacterium]|nr:dihydrofolate reductase [Candidatus Woesebacteria bacterium]